MEQAQGIRHRTQDLVGREEATIVVRELTAAQPAEKAGPPDAAVTCCAARVSEHARSTRSSLSWAASASRKVVRIAVIPPARAERWCRFLPARGAEPALATVTTDGWLVGVDVMLRPLPARPSARRQHAEE